MLNQTHTTYSGGNTPAPAVQVLNRGEALLTGTHTHPEIRVTCHYQATHAATGELLRTWLKAMPGARWNKASNEWIVTGTPRHPDQMFNSAGIAVTIDHQAHPHATSLEHLYQPVSEPHPNGHSTIVHHRLAGFIETQHLLGKAASWDKQLKSFTLPLLDVYQNNQLRPRVEWDLETQWAAYRLVTKPASQHPHKDMAGKYGKAISMGPVSEQWAEQHIGGMPDWWEAELFAFQKPGMLALTTGHTLLADPPGLGKTIQFIAFTAITRAKRILVICPPVVAINWEREYRKTGYPHDITVILAGRKQPKTLPETGVVIVPDSLITSRAELRQQIIDWQPEALGIDEAHRIKTWDSKRTQAVLDVAHHLPVGRRVPITGTPVISSPHELVPLLLVSGHMAEVFGSVDRFLTRFCTQPPFGGFQPKKTALPELNMLLDQHVWVRREKERVLPFLPEKQNNKIELMVDTKPYREAHNEVIDKITDWVETVTNEYGAPPGLEDVEEYVARSIEHISMLRRASAHTKLPVATDMILEHVTADPNNDSPLVCWFHHKEVLYALSEMLDEHEIEYRVLAGGVSEKQRQKNIDDFQAGKVQVMLAGLTAAGVGVTLTRGRDMIFVECDWTPAIVSQAIDRMHRIGQTHPVQARTLVALKTLDEHVQRILERKENTANTVHGDDHSKVAVLTGGDQVSARELLRELVLNVLDKYRRQTGYAPLTA